MRILITGAAGFIGSHLGNKLRSLGHDVQGVDSYAHSSDNEVTFPIERMDFRKLTTLSGYDVVFHLAAHINVDESINDPKGYMDNNTTGTQHLLELARQVSVSRKIKFIFASSAEVYGSATSEVMDEDHQLDPLSPYAVSKLSAEQLCKVYAQVYGLDVTVIRNFNTFGEHQNGGVYGGVIAKFAKLASEGKPLPVYGSGEQTRDYMHISQAVNGYVLAMEARLPLITNFGSGTEYKILDIANRIAESFDVGVQHENPRPNELMRLKADVTRAKRYGYKVETDFWTNLDNYLSWTSEKSGRPIKSNVRSLGN